MRRKQLHRRELVQENIDNLSGLHPVLARVYAGRGVKTAADLDYDLVRLLPPGDLKGMDDAVTLLQQALQEQQHIMIVGDFDADGATSCAVAVRALTQLGASRVSFLVPNRFEYGYGLTPEIVELAGQQSPDIIVTVDNGISSVEGVATARKKGFRVLITDHHLAGEQLPDADAMVNPNQPGDEFASKCLAGVGVIFYVMLALRARLRESGWFGEATCKEPNLASLLDLVALGTVADVVPLDYNNRILVAQGLKRINAGRACAGIQALLQVAKITPGRLQASDLAFRIAPRLNAAGRLDDMSLGIDCLLSHDRHQALALAQQLDQLNSERKVIQQDMERDARAAVSALHLDEAGLPYGLCLFDKQWHQGVVGLVAARIKEQCHRPVIAFAQSEDHELKGSARSIPGLHIRDALDAVAVRHPTLLKKFGGHAMAAGLTLLSRDFETFSLAFDEEVRRSLRQEDLQACVMTDGILDPCSMNLEFAQALAQAGPWGQGFPDPLFEGAFEIVQRRVVGQHHLKLVLRINGHDACIDAIAFNGAPQGKLTGAQYIHAAYRPEVNEFRGQQSLQFMIEYFHESDSTTTTT
ncbi:MAG: single-stranded-DNA-specific exonuclease RecJ [Gammaproteobacteria bacterium]|nr:MAG: single-stranded-DNA-specific exonuclease RecJ [Gammaproteobacteria bacterium]